MSLITLTYVSAATTPFSRLDIAELLTCCRRNNAATNISGLLLYHGGNFLQVLEGEEDAVLDLKTRIARDPRHTRMTVMLVRDIHERQFGDWSMAFRDVGDSGDASEVRPDALPGYSDYLDPYLESSDIGGQLRTLLESFRRSMR